MYLIIRKEISMAKQKTVHYVDNKKFHQAMIEWKEQCKDAEESGSEPPRISNYIGAVSYTHLTLPTKQPV